MKGEKVEGLVLKRYSGFYYVQDKELTVFECKLRGKVKDGIILTGDKVIIRTLEANKGIIEEVLPRINELYRPRIANITKVFIVLANDRPAPSILLLDRLLFLAYFNSIKPCIVLNKADLGKNKDTDLIEQYYPTIGVDVVVTSTKKNLGIETLKDLIKGEISVFAGPSGAGKSSLLNLLIDGINIKTQEVSDRIGRGKHTTRHVELFTLDNGGLIADTPGFSILDLPKLNKADLVEYFPDLYEHTSRCKFNDCLHWKENDCGVKEAVDEGVIAPFRYENYLTMLQEVIENERCY
ncbi:MAG TPA: ribosome small subunit-dependent GTPase A [Syntrophomonadaceae bacterium]|nr:ribosome small subunit-dependent GTPase A [Syntrophomonadaceae bacterium]